MAGFFSVTSNQLSEFQVFRINQAFIFFFPNCFGNSQRNFSSNYFNCFSDLSVVINGLFIPFYESATNFPLLPQKMNIMWPVLKFRLQFV